MKTNTAKAVWNGALKDGSGKISISSMQLEMLYTFSSRFEDGVGTNPEELIAAAHAGCFTMALSGLLTERGYEPKSISTTAELQLKKAAKGFRISSSNLITEAEVPEITEPMFMKLAVDAKSNCPVSKALSSVKINLQARLIR
jgi:osmotically inducible protein OsmC